MFTANFVYNEPGVGSIDVDADTIWENDAIVKLIEEKYPEYVDIEITGVEQID